MEDNTYSQYELQELAARASSLGERLRGDVVPAFAPDDEKRVASRMERWRWAAGGGEELVARWALDGLEESRCRPLLGSVRWPDGRPLPAWTGTLQDILRNVEDAWCPTANPVPFQQLLLPFVRWGRRALLRAGVQVLGAAAIDDLLEELLQRLGALSSLALGKHFQLHRALRNPLELLLDSATPDPDDGAYRRFIDDMLAGGLPAFFREHAVLGRLLVEELDRWLSTSALFCRRLRDDLPAIADKLHGGANPGAVARLWPRLSDPHDAGQSVIRVAFEGGLSLVYKPKSLQTDEAFFALVDWLGERGALPLRLATPRVLDRGAYGWMELVENAGCNDQGALRRYYQRAGMLLCLVWALGGTDCHHENLIAEGEHPVLVDTETLLYPRSRPFGMRPGTESADQLAGEAAAETVFATGLLPVWLMGANGRSYDLSGFAADEDQSTGDRILGWHAVNSDGMMLAEREEKFRRSGNIPLLRGAPQPPRGFVEEIVEGFGFMYRCLLRNRDRLLADDGPLARFAGCGVRYVARYTRAYGHLLMRLRHPAFLADGVDRSIEIEVLARTFLQSQEPAERLWPICRAEQRAIERNDVPLFVARHDDPGLRADGVVAVDDFFQTSGLAAMRERFARIALEDLDLHAAHIRAAFGARYGEAPRVEVAPRPPERDESLTAGELIDAACAIAHTIEAQALRGADHSVTWLTFELNAVTERWLPGPMGNTLYGGRCGVALFLAALASATGERAYRDLALASIDPLRSAIAHASGDRAASILGLGGGSGIGGMLYGLARVGRFLDDDNVVRDAGRMVTWITDERIAADAVFDVIGGAAGCILGLLALADDAALERAVACSRHLLRKRRAAAWKSSVATRPLTGFSHGAAGIAYALLRLARETGDRELVNAAAEAIAYEDALFDDEHQNWPDLRDDHANATGYAATWCHGAPGIGLARLGALDVLQTDAVLRDVERALATTRRTFSSTEPDHLCCGSLGKTELLIEASRRLRRPELFAEAKSVAASLVRRAHREGRYRLNTSFAEVARVPSLFQGSAGIGYQLLRLGDPDRFPPALLWELERPASPRNN